MHDLLTYIIDSIFPPRADDLLVRTLSPEHVTSRYAPHAVQEILALSVFHDPHIRALIHEAKYERNKNAQRLLSTLLREHFKKHPRLTDAVWIPIPLSASRMRERGYNQVESVLANTPLPYDTTILTRTRDTKRQTELPKDARLANVHGAFTCTKPDSLYQKNIVLLDDVVTTGATLMAAKQAFLEHNPASITLIALAH